MFLLFGITILARNDYIMLLTLQICCGCVLGHVFPIVTFLPFPLLSLTSLPPSLQRAKLEKMPSIPEEPEVPDYEVERFTMPDFVKPLYDLDVIEGKETVLKCKVAGLPYPTIVWFHNGKKIDSTEDRKMTQCELRLVFYKSSSIS